MDAQLFLREEDWSGERVSLFGEACGLRRRSSRNCWLGVVHKERGTYDCDLDHRCDLGWAGSGGDDRRMIKRVDMKARVHMISREKIFFDWQPDNTPIDCMVSNVFVNIV